MSEISDCYLVGCECNDSRLKNNASICFNGVKSEIILLMLSQKGIYASAGSACNSSENSYVLDAIGVPGRNVIRFTFDNNTIEETNIVVDELIKIINLLRK